MEKFKNDLNSNSVLDNSNTYTDNVKEICLQIQEFATDLCEEISNCDLFIKNFDSIVITEELRKLSNDNLLWDYIQIERKNKQDTKLWIEILSAIVVKNSELGQYLYKVK